MEIPDTILNEYWDEYKKSGYTPATVHARFHLFLNFLANREIL